MKIIFDMEDANWEVLENTDGNLDEFMSAIREDFVERSIGFPGLFHLTRLRWRGWWTGRTGDEFRRCADFRICAVEGVVGRGVITGGVE